MERSETAESRSPPATRYVIEYVYHFPEARQVAHRPAWLLVESSLMPIPSKSRYPLESFDPRLRDIWLTAIRQPVEITLANSKVAIAFQNRLQQYRAALKRESPEDARMFYRAKCTRDGNIVRVARQDLEFEDVLDQLDSQLITKSSGGSPVPEAPVPAGPAATPLPEESSISLDFNDLFVDIPVTFATEDEDNDH